MRGEKGSQNETKPDLVRTNFAELSTTYSDESRRLVIPCFDDFYQAGVSVLTTEQPNPRILDLGAGTGLYAAFLLNRYPGASLTLVDFADEMLELARQRFAGHLDVTYVTGDYTVADVGEGFDIVISALSIHHLTPEGKAALFRRVYSLLNPGGEFLNADQILCPDPEVQSRYEEAWLSLCKANGLTHEQLVRMKQSMALDDPSTIDDQLLWLREAGFAIADCVYKHMNFAVFYARR